ncbi:MAG TPA: GNAT family N-acetyltransferase [Caulobacteraceae bacterium]|jgi:ribosomal protein S18 acetylase RimI-like enzyme
MSNLEVRSAGPSERAAVIAILTLAFSVDPPVRYIWPKAQDYLAGFGALAAAIGGPAFADGTAFVTDDGSAAALWLAPGAERDAEAISAASERFMDPERRKAISAAFSQTADYHPQEPHWYLPLIGVDPACQGKGLGSRLMSHALTLIDADGLPAFLESSNIRNVPLYERHGFEVLGVIDTGETPPLYPMLRRPSRPVS